jgi:hypothetical protein
MERRSYEGDPQDLENQVFSPVEGSIVPVIRAGIPATML